MGNLPRVKGKREEGEPAPLEWTPLGIYSRGGHFVFGIFPPDNFPEW